MANILGKTVYVLGAGASFHMGAPLLADFLVTARLLRDGKDPLTYKESFDRVFDWIDRLRGSSYYVEFDLDNLEHVFSLAEMGKQLKLEGADQLFSDLRYVVTETLDVCRVKYSEEQLRPSGPYHSFVSRLVGLNEERRGLITGSLQRDVIVTFNYDVMLDYAFYFSGIRKTYGFEERNTTDFVLLKLHGSTNWVTCKACNSEIQIVPASPIPAGATFHHSLEQGREYPFRMVTRVLRNTKCKNCGDVGKLEPFTIPPTWSKMVTGSPLQEVWARAVEEIKTAYQIVVIGYSMPSTDTFFQYLLTLGLQSNAGFHRVVVVNNDNSEALKQRYRRVFSRSLMDRGRLKFREVSFEEFVQGHMAQIESRTEIV
jgi:hypothetical protein